MTKMLEIFLLIFYVAAVAGRLSSFAALGIDTLDIEIFDRLMTKIVWIAIYSLMLAIFFIKKREMVFKRAKAFCNDIKAGFLHFIKKYVKLEYIPLVAFSLFVGLISAIFAYKVKHGLIGVAYYAVLMSIPVIVKHIWNSKIEKTFFKVTFVLNFVMLALAYWQFKAYFVAGENHPLISIMDSYGGFMPLSFFRLEHDSIIYLRPSALMIDPNYLAVFAGFAVVFAYENFRLSLKTCYKAGSRIIEIILSLVGFLSAVGLIIISGSRTGYIVLMVSTLAYWLSLLWYKRLSVKTGNDKVKQKGKSGSQSQNTKKNILSVSILDMLVKMRDRFIGAVTLQDESAKQHLILAKIGLEIFKKFPILGIGIGSYTFYYQDFFDVETLGATPHNTYIRVLAELGAIGFLSFIGMAYYFVKRALHERSPMLIALLAGILIGNNFQDFFMTPWNWFILGLFLVERDSF